jgi:hypothetical protein
MDVVLHDLRRYCRSVGVVAMTRQQFPDSQKERLGPKQIAWIDERYGKAFFRDAKPMVTHTEKPC